MKKYGLVIFLTIVLLSGCAAPRTTLSPMQVRNITTKHIEGDYEDIYRACITVFQDQGYVIKNTDMDTGLIVAYVDRESSKNSQFWQSFWAGYVYNKGTAVEVSCMVNKISDNASDVRINIQETTYSQWGSKQNIKQIYDKEVYRNIFNEIITEVKRREAIQGSSVKKEK
ncbi:MAG: hypothetical protein K9L95_06240 [Candidatus Omnitrophica bacterium]|nr:hypothetical protein [Candidatus Omnitrophota bacterium]MCF7877686.1 hypothetical protein [Candidatus Omnitrophota bacterium]MCF7879045.1 hypothetical protein [Candidatus Omnitrophota bacterium]